MRDRRAEFEAGRIATTSGRPPENFEPGAPEPIDPRTGQHKSYWVLSESERAKGFVRPVRNAYKHVGVRAPRYPLRDLTEDEKARPGYEGYVKYEEYPESESPVVGSFWSQARLDNVGKGCGSVTTMGRALAETYARDPHFYGATMCVNCGLHRPVDEFVWVSNGDATDERLGS